MQEPPAQDQPTEEGSNEDIHTELPPEPEAPLADYDVSAGDPVQETIIQLIAQDTPSTVEPTEDVRQPEPPIASGPKDEDAPTDDPAALSLASPQLPLLRYYTRYTPYKKKTV